MGGVVSAVGGLLEDVGGAIGGAVESVGDFVQDNVIDPIADVGSDIDDFVNEEIPGGWITVAAATTGAYLGAEAFAGTTVADSAAASAAAAGTAEAATAAASLGNAATVGAVVADGLPILGATTAELGITAIPAVSGAGLATGAGIAAGTGMLGGATVPSAFGTAVEGALAGTPGIGAFGPVGTAGFGTALPAAADVAAGLTGAGFAAGTAANLAGQTAAGTGATGLLGGATSILGTTAGGLNINGLGQVLNQAGQVVQQLSSSQVGQFLGSAAQAAVANNLAEQNAAALRDLGAQAAQRAEQIGAGANVPFTPYTVTTGLGTSQVTPTGATATAAAPYQALQQAALQRSQEALGAISPAQTTQTLFGQLEALQGPARQREQEALLSRLGARGLLGIGQNLPTVGGGMGTVNPYMESLLSAQAQQQAQNALAAQQFGTQEAARQQALAQALQTQGLGIDEATRQQLATAGTLGLGLQQQALTGAANQARAGLAGLGLQTELNISAADIDAIRRRQIAQAVQSGIGNLGGALTGAGNLLSGAGTLGSTVGGLFSRSPYTSVPATTGFGTGDLFGNIDYGTFF